MKTPWAKRDDPKYAQQERRTARKPGARAQVNSGRTWSSLRDVKQESPLGHVLIDNKTTDNKSYSITEADFKSLKRDANRTPPGCHPALQVDLRSLRLMVIEEDLWDEITEYVRTLEGMLDGTGRP